MALLVKHNYVDTVLIRKLGGHSSYQKTGASVSVPPPYKLNVIVTNCSDIGGKIGNYDVQLVMWGHAHARPNFLIRTVSTYVSQADPIAKDVCYSTT